MLDIKFIRENLDVVKAGAKKKRIEVDLDRLIEVDDMRRKLLQETEALRAEQNVATGKIARAASGTQRAQFIEEMKGVKETLGQKEKEFEPIQKEWELLMVQVPNVPDVSVPDGESDADNQEIKQWGDKKTFDFPARSHVDLMQELGMADFERGVKVSGFRGYFLKGDGALLSFAVQRYAQDFFLRKGFTPMIVPSLVKRVNFLGTGYIPQGEDDLYKTQDGEYLSGTAEVATMGYHLGDTVDIKELPIKYLSFSPCFRREAGSHGKDVKGLIRVHEFYKWEQVILCEASHEESVKWHEWLNRNTEELIEELEIPYRTVVNAGGDLGLGQVKKYDIELWVPSGGGPEGSEGTYREISSASYFHDFQTRRLNIRYKDAEGKMRFAHSLNSTALPTPRILVSLVENFQQEDGSITIPKVLQSYFGKDTIMRA